MSRLMLPAILFSGLTAFAQDVRTQKSEIQPAVVQGDVEDPVETQGIPDADFRRMPETHWIWGSDDNRKYTISREFEIAGDIQAARLSASCDNACAVFVNGKRVGGGTEWAQPFDADVKKHLQTGLNKIHAEVENQGGVAAFVLKMAVRTDADDL
ncbi:MAG: heme-binding protein, partial [Planctomycetaceae bacterium]